MTPATLTGRTTSPDNVHTAAQLADFTLYEAEQLAHEVRDAVNDADTFLAGIFAHALTRIDRISRNAQRRAGMPSRTAHPEHAAQEVNDAAHRVHRITADAFAAATFVLAARADEAGQ